MDPQATDFPHRQPYEGKVVGRDDPQGLGRVRVRIPGQWDPYGPWCPVIGGKGSGAGRKLGVASVPPVGADVLVFFVCGEAENPRVLAAHHGADEVPDGASVATDAESKAGEGDNRVYQDERVKVEVDARAASYGIRITPLASGLTANLEVDMATGQIGLDTSLGVLIKSAASVRIEAPVITINERPVLSKGQPI